MIGYIRTIRCGGLHPGIMPIGVAPRAEHVETERDEPQHCKEPVEEIEAAGVEVGAAEPPMAAPAAATTTASGDVVDHLDK